MGAGNISISQNCIDYIRTLIPDGSTILELGSGQGTVLLSEYFKMYSVENQPEWFSKFPLCTTYINCRSKMYDDEYTAPDIPNSKGWYHPDDIFSNLPKSYDLILIDGPGGSRWGRGGFYKHIDEFNINVPMIFDDVNRGEERELVKKVSDHLNRPFRFLESDTSVGYIL